MFRIAEAIEKGEDNDTLEKWARAAKTAPMCVVVLLPKNLFPARLTDVGLPMFFRPFLSLLFFLSLSHSLRFIIFFYRSLSLSFYLSLSPSFSRCCNTL